ncbi:capsular biosynthesis protein [Massilia sp. 9096]|uniref:capsular biosynthesis protein n=1 Tax=Massilia sp. 9096 TaxID=1500894 RepID=UPI000569F275|nr:capsular biosynthesis protein [Massilia sp. 9096]
MKRLIIDLDDTITLSAQDGYENALPNLALVARLREYQADGFEIVISTSRNVRTYDGNIGKINAYTLPVIVAWLEKHAVPFDEIHVGKPWCGREGFYVDDKSIRPSEFLRHSLSDIHALLALEKTGA